MEARYLLRPASAGELLDTAIGMVRRYFPAYLAKTWLLYLVAASLDFISRLPAAPRFFPLFSLLVGLAVGATVEVRLACASRDLLEGRDFGATPVAPILRKRWAAIIFGYMIKWIFVIVGFAVLILPGAYMIALYFGVPCISAFEDLGLRGARYRSRELARRYIGRVFVTIGLFDIAAVLLGFAILLVLGRGHLLQIPVWARGVNWALGLVLTPIRSALTAAVYLDCRVRSEGYDLDHSAALVTAG